MAESNGQDNNEARVMPPEVTLLSSHSHKCLGPTCLQTHMLATEPAGSPLTLAPPSHRSSRDTLLPHAFIYKLHPPPHDVGTALGPAILLLPSFSLRRQGSYYLGVLLDPAFNLELDMQQKGLIPYRQAEVNRRSQLP